ncbi:MAG: DUF6789 family protein [Pseudomonadota bacterium]
MTTQDSITGRTHIRNDIIAILIAGAIAETVFEIIAWLVTPALFGFALQPAFLIDALSTIYLGLPLGYPTAFGLHVLAGIVLFPLGYRLMISILPIKPAWITGTIWGVILWFLAQGILAPLAGRLFMMDWSAFTWASLIGHVIYGLALGVAYKSVLSRL